ncbi:MAG: ECF-type sigma factor [Pseudomarimonas sp.]
MGEVTELIALARDGDRAASERLFAQVYRDLHRLAARQLGPAQHAMQTTSLVHEAYFRLAKPDALVLSDRVHFFAVAARAMRQLVIDRARARLAEKRGSGRAVSLDDVRPEVLGIESNGDVFALAQALDHLAALDPQLAQLVDLRFFAGLDLTEIAEITQRSERSLKRDWRKARAFLHAQMGDPTSVDRPGIAVPDGNPITPVIDPADTE